MSYVIDKENNDFKLSYFNVNISGLDITPKNNYPGISYRASKLTIIDPELSTTYIKKRINNKINKLIAFMLKILNDEDTSEGDAGLVLDEVSRLKGIIYNKYKEHLKIEDYKSLISKIIIVEEEFKKNYNQKIFLNQMRNNIIYNDYDYNNEISGGRSR